MLMNNLELHNVCGGCRALRILIKFIIVKRLRAR